MRGALLCGLLIVTMAEAMWAGEGCSREAVTREAATAKQVQGRLLAVKADEMDTVVPEAAKKDIAAMKEALAATVDAYMGCAAATLDSKQMVDELAGRLEANRPEAPFVASKENVHVGLYGTELKIGGRESVASGGGRLVSIEASFGIACGMDSMLLVYELRGGKWQRAVRWQSGEYGEVSGAFGDFFTYSVIPKADLSGGWAVAVAHGMPWCTSRMSGFEIDVIRPEGERKQRVIAHVKHGYSRGDMVPKMKATGDGQGFDLRLSRSSADMNVFEYVGIFRYRLTGDGMERVQPIAMNGRGFVEEWLAADWSDAERWSDTGAKEALRLEHARVNKTERGEGGELPSYGAVRGCAEDGKHFQVEVGHEKAGTVYFQIEQGVNSFTMVAAGGREDARCKGADIMKRTGASAAE